MTSKAYFTGVHPVKFFAKDSAADLSAGIMADLTGVEYPAPNHSIVNTDVG